MTQVLKAYLAAIALSLGIANAQTQPITVTIGEVVPTSVSASATINIEAVSGTLCDVRAVISGDDFTYTNLLATGVAPGSHSYSINRLNSGVDYSVKMLVTDGSAAVESSPSEFSTLAVEIPLNAYVQDGLLLWLDGIYNAVDETGRPVKSPGATTWADLKGNYTLVNSGNGEEVVHNGKSYIFAADKRHFAIDDASAISDAVIAGTFTIESSLNLLSAPTITDGYYAAYSLGSGSAEKPRTLCFDMRYEKGGSRRGAIQFNASKWVLSSAYLTAYTGNGFVEPSTFAVVGGGAVNVNGTFYHSGVSKSRVVNQKAYNIESAISKKLNIRYYSDKYAGTRYDAFRAYNRVLSDAEIALNSAIDGVRFRDETPPASIAPEFSVSFVDNYVEGGIQLRFQMTSPGWPATKLESLVLECSTTPDFANPLTLQVGSDIAENQNFDVEGFEPGKTYYARVTAQSALGLSSTVHGLEFKSSSGPSNDPVFVTDGEPVVSAEDGEITINVLLDGGAECGAFAVVESVDGVFTNSLFSGMTGSGTKTCKISPLSPGNAYTVTLYVTNSLGGVSESVVQTFETPDVDWFVNPYISDGLLSLYDGIYNTTNEYGTPVHSSATAVTSWADLMGTHPVSKTSTKGEIHYGNKYVRFSNQGHLTCNSAAPALDAIISGKFTVETTAAFRELTKSYPAFYSFGCGSSSDPRMLCFDARVAAGKIGSMQYNRNDSWSDASMLFEPGAWNFLTTNTYSAVGGGNDTADGMLYINGEAKVPFVNHRHYQPFTLTKKVFSIHHYDFECDTFDCWSFRIYNRCLSEQELAANRIADQVRFFGLDASLNIVSKSVKENVLTVTLERSGSDMEADVFAIVAPEFKYGSEKEIGTGCRFEKGAERVTLSIPLEPDTMYVWFKAGGLVTRHSSVYVRGGADALALTSQSIKSVSGSSAIVQTGVVMPADEAPVELYAEYGFLPDALNFTAKIGTADMSDIGSGVCDGELRGLQPERTYYLQVVAKRNGVEVGRTAAVSKFTTAAIPVLGPLAPVKIVGTNVVDGKVESLVVSVDSGRACELWMYSDRGDRGFDKNAWGNAAKVADVTDAGGEFTVLMPEGWGEDVTALRFATGTVTPVENVTMVAAGDSCIDTKLYIKGSATIKMDLAFNEVVSQMLAFRAGSSSSFTYYGYINSRKAVAYAWSVGEGNWETTSVSPTTGRIMMVFDGSYARWGVRNATGSMKHTSAGSPVDVVADTPLYFFGPRSTATANITLWSAQVLDEKNTVTLGDYVPAKCDGVPCLYDRISRCALFPNSGTLSAGEDIEGAVVELANVSEVFAYVDAASVRINPEVKVEGHESGSSLTFSGTVENAQRVTVNGIEAQLDDSGAWSLTIDGIEPGVPYECNVVAYGAAGVDVLPTFVETPLAASKLSALTTVVLNQRTVKFSGSLLAIGANETVVTLLTGPSADAMTNTCTMVKSAGDDLSFDFTVKFPEFDVPVSWAFAIENSVPGNDAWNWSSTNNVAAVTPVDRATYTWGAVEGDWNGKWSDKARWTSDMPEDCIGLPCTGTSIAAISQGTIELDMDATVKDILFGVDGPVTFTGGAGSLSIAAQSTKPFKVPDGAHIFIKDGAVFNAPVAVNIGASSSSVKSYAGSITVSNATFTFSTVDLTHEGTLCIQDGAIVTGVNVYFCLGNPQSSLDNFAAPGGILRFEGANPLLTLSGDLRTYNSTSVVSEPGCRIEFKVPSGGYLQTPLVMVGTSNGNTFCGDSKVDKNSKQIIVTVTGDSPIYGSSSKVDFELASWRDAHGDSAKLVSLQPMKGAKSGMYITSDYKTLRATYEGAAGLLLILK